VASRADPAVAGMVHASFPDATVIPVDDGHPGGARNVLMEKARGELLLFLDDDITINPDLLADLHQTARRHPDSDVFGGPNLTPEGSSRFQVVQGAVLASLVATGPVRHRYGAHPAGPANERYFTLCNLAVRRSVMVPFDPGLLCAEENAVLAELHDRGIQMHYDPDMVAFHERRADYTGFRRQMFTYGRGRGQVIRVGPVGGLFPHALPILLLAYLVALPALVLALGWPALVLLAAWVGVVLAGAVKIGASLRRPVEVPKAAALIVTVHLCYGAGVLWGMVRRRPVAGALAVVPAVGPMDFRLEPMAAEG